MKKVILPFLALLLSLLSPPAFSQNKATTTNKEDTTELLGLPGDNLDLYAVLELFQKSKTIEGFEKSLNDDKLKINNLDLDLDKKVDFIKVVTKKDGDSYTFILQIDVNKKETQDVAVIFLNKDKSGKISLQIVGDEELYGKDYIIEPKGNSSVTANPGYVGPDPVTKDIPVTTTVVVQSAPIVQYVYSPVYVPYYPPYYYGFPPPWFGFATVMAVGIYRSNHYYGGYHGGYHGGHYHGGNNTVIINNGNRNSINHYNNNRNRSATVSDNMNRGNYGNRTSGGRNGAGASAGTLPSNRGGSGSNFSNRQTPSTSNRQSPSTSNRQSPSTSNRQTPSTSNRQSPSTSNRSSFNGGGRSSSNSGGGGGRSMGGGSRGGGGGRRR